MRPGTAVGESVEMPLEYYGTNVHADTNVHATLALARGMAEHDVRRLISLSSCSIYGAADPVPIDEAAPAGPTNPYARTTWMCEQILADLCARDPDWHVASLR